MKAKLTPKKIMIIILGVFIILGIFLTFFYQVEYSQEKQPKIEIHKRNRDILE